jgi:predicted ATPase
VVGDVGGGARQEQLALGETPNVAARLQGLAAPNTLVISAATLQLLGGFFACQPLGTPLLKGLAQPLAVYRVLYESMARSRLEAASSTGWTPLVGREQEIGVLVERWTQVKEGVGQVVLLSGEAGIGKSRLVQVLTDQVAAESQAWLTPCQCSPYHQHTALYPLIDLLERVVLRFEREASPQQKVGKLEGFLVQYGLPLAEAVPLFAALLSLPLPADYAPVLVSPEQQKQQTLHALLTILLRIAAQRPVLFVMEDLHWVDPSTLELLSLLVDQGPTARILTLFTCWPDFSPPWTGRAHLTQLTVNRLPRRQAEEVIRQVAHGKVLPPEVVEQIVAKTDGVPLFVEELTKMVLESGLLLEQAERYVLTGLLPPLAIPTTLHDALMARLDRLATVKGLAQLGATLGREFSYALLHAVSPWDEVALGQGLHQLVEAEFLYQQGLPPQATYVFKHALIQDTAYQSLLRSTRQQYHQRIAQVLVERFPDTVETQPELLAHHYTEAGLNEQAVVYWQRAGERAIERSAHVEAVAHLTEGLELLKTLPATRERVQQELTFQRALGVSLITSKGFNVPEVERTYARARDLCAQLGDSQEIVPVLFGLWGFYHTRHNYLTARELAEELLTVAERHHDPALILQGHRALGDTLQLLGEFDLARAHLEEGIALYDVQQHRSHTYLYGQDPGVGCLGFAGKVLWMLGYPEQALQRCDEALTLARELAHPFNLALALSYRARLLQLCRDRQATLAAAEELIALATAEGFPFYQNMGEWLRGWALVQQGYSEKGMGQIQVLAYPRRTSDRLLLAETYEATGQIEDGLRVVADTLAAVDKSGQRDHKAELNRLRGGLLLKHIVPDEKWAATCFQKALNIARQQHAKSLELRAAMSLSRLWQQQGKQAEAHVLLAPIYGWFTEGFDTKDLQEAKVLLEALA